LKASAARVLSDNASAWCGRAAAPQIYIHALISVGFLAPKFRLPEWQLMKHRKNTKPAEPQGRGVLHEQIGLRAYHIWLASDGGHGNDLQHWFQAEKETRASALIADPRNSDSQEEPNTQIEP
jgi:hypothetical protein